MTLDVWIQPSPSLNANLGSNQVKGTGKLPCKVSSIRRRQTINKISMNDNDRGILPTLMGIFKLNESSTVPCRRVPTYCFC